MPKKGDDLDAITAAAAIDHHSNASALINGQPVGVIFDRLEVVEDDVLVARSTLTMATDETVGLSKSDPVVVGSKNYKYSYQTDDGTGMSLVVLKDDNG
ncbi:MAG: hypothetical protein OEX07_09650 [Gammaproteobacteria bacterium]|nr:hypothetical protein [Gammaproteobacteria bacterium]